MRLCFDCACYVQVVRDPRFENLCGVLDVDGSASLIVSFFYHVLIIYLHALCTGSAPFISLNASAKLDPLHLLFHMV